MSFDLRGFLLGDALLVNKTGCGLKVNVRLLSGGNQMFFIPVGEEHYVSFEEADRGPTLMRAWRLGRAGFFETKIRAGRAYVLKF